MKESSTFACMAGPYHIYNPISGDHHYIPVHSPPVSAPTPTLAPVFTLPMKTWMEHVANELGCKHSELMLCRRIENGVEETWWERRK